MPDPHLVLDPQTQQDVVEQMRKDILVGKYALTSDRAFVLDPQSGDPSRSALAKRVREQLGPYVDFETGGLKLLELNIGGNPAKFTLVPRWQPDLKSGDYAQGSIALKFTMHF
jgi:hypothetical protein